MLGIAVWVYMAASAVATALNFSVVNTARDYAKDDSMRQAFKDAIKPVDVLGSIASLAELVIVVASLIWTYRTAKQIGNKGLLLRFSPIMCLFSWVLPPVLFVFPLLVLRDFANKTTNLRNDPTNRMKSLITQWWVLYGVVPLLMSFFGAAISNAIPRSEQELAKALSDQIVPNTISALSLIAAAYLWRQLVVTMNADVEI